MAEENAFVKDLCKAQSEMENAIFDKTNPYFKSKYASLAAVRAAIKPLSNHGFATVQTMRIHFGAQGEPICMILSTVLEHVSGETRADERYIALGTAQEMGADETYARRRALSAVTNIASEEDDDANAGSASHQKNPSQVRKSGLYVELEKECRLINDLDRLKRWWSERQDDIKTMPPPHRTLIEAEKDRRKLELIDKLDRDKPLTQALKASIALTEEEQEEIDPPDFLNDLDSQMKDANDEATVMEIWKEFGGILENLPTADQHQAQGIFERHMRGLKATSAVKAMKAARK